MSAIFIFPRLHAFTNPLLSLCVRTKVSSQPTDRHELLDNVYSQAISWYPGHIAKAERELAGFLKKVDVVVEVRDARIPLTTTHPLVPKWVGDKPLIVAVAREDQISTTALNHWKKYYSSHAAHEGRPDVKVLFVDGKRGAGVIALRKQILKAEN